MPNPKLKWKVCGMREEKNIRDVAALSPDLMGFIFYPRSPRFVGDQLDPAVVRSLNGIGRVGVFVDQKMDEILQLQEEYQLDYVQLHGDEPVATVAGLASRGLKVIKVMAGNRPQEQEFLSSYEPYIKFWLFDTRLNTHGGTGVVFDWSVLETMKLKRPVILSGGIGPEQLRSGRLQIPRNVWGIDINSQVEHAPAIKNMEKISQVMELL